MDQSSAALQLTGELQRCGNVVSDLRGATLVVDTSQSNAYEDLVVTLRESDDFKDLKVSEDGGEFAYLGTRFKITRDGIITYIGAVK